MRPYKYSEDKVIDGVKGIVESLNEKVRTTNNVSGVCPLHGSLYGEIADLAKSLKIMARQAQHWQE